MDGVQAVARNRAEAAEVAEVAEVAEAVAAVAAEAAEAGVYPRPSPSRSSCASCRLRATFQSKLSTRTWPAWCHSLGWPRILFEWSILCRASSGTFNKQPFHFFFSFCLLSFFEFAAASGGPSRAPGFCVSRTRKRCENSSRRVRRKSLSSKVMGALSGFFPRSISVRRDPNPFFLLQMRPRTSRMWRLPPINVASSRCDNPSAFFP